MLPTHCYICGCETPLGGEGIHDKVSFVKIIVIFTCKYRGPAYSQCNLLAKKPKFIPLVFHNLQGYDSHLFINKRDSPSNITYFPSTDEKYISFSKKIRVYSFTNKEGEEVDVNLSFVFLILINFYKVHLIPLLKILNLKNWKT